MRDAFDDHCQGDRQDRRDGPAPMSCGAVRARLPMLPAEELLATEDLGVREHLLSCMPCRQELGGFLRARKALQTMVPQQMMESRSAFFDTLREDTLQAVRESQTRSRRTSRGSWAGVMTAAALFLIGVYLVPSPSAYRDLPSISTTVMPQESWNPSAGGARFHDVGYGLMGHEVRPLEPVPLPAAESEEPAPERDAGVRIRKRRGR